MLLVLLLLPAFHCLADGGYFSRRSVAVSTDQKAILVKNGEEISMTFSTGYTGEWEDFGWIIPTPVPPAIEDVIEAGASGEEAFKVLDRYSAPVVSVLGGGCFPSGTEVLTASGSVSIETVAPGTKVYAGNPCTGEWVLDYVVKRFRHDYDGDVITILVGPTTIQATGNHPFFVLRGDGLASRPLPQDVPNEESSVGEHGRWVEARDLTVGEVLFDRSATNSVVAGVSSRHEKTVVYNLDVEGHNTYAVGQLGILVHNKGSAEGASNTVVTVYGTVTLENYEVSILGATRASALMSWLEKNHYQVNPAAQEVLDMYIAENWAFVAVKLNPGEKRRYENEFLPPLTIKYRYDDLVFPLRISSTSTTQTARVSLYVIAESTVSSPNFPTTPLKFEASLPKSADPVKYIEACIQRTLGNRSRGLVLMWSGEFAQWATQRGTVDGLMKTPLREGQKMYLTRLETRIDPAAMTEDIKIVLDPVSNRFSVALELGSGFADGTGSAARFAYPSGIIRVGTDLYVTDLKNHNVRKIVMTTGAVTTIAGDAGQ